MSSSTGVTEGRDLFEGDWAFQELRDAVEAQAPASEGAFQDLRLLLVVDDPTAGDAMAENLRALGAWVALTDSRGNGLERARGLDPEVVLVDPSALRCADGKLAHALHSNPRLRWATVIRASWPDLWPDGDAAPDIVALSGLLRPAVSQDRRITEQADTEYRFVTQLGRLGPNRLLRALTHAGPILHLSLRTPGACGELDVAGGLVVSARWKETDSLHSELEGAEALAKFLTQQIGQLIVERRDVVSCMNIMLPVDEALDAAGKRLKDLQLPVPTGKYAALTGEKSREALKAQSATFGPPEDRPTPVLGPRRVSRTATLVHGAAAATPHASEAVAESGNTFPVAQPQPAARHRQPTLGYEDIRREMLGAGGHGSKDERHTDGARRLTAASVTHGTPRDLAIYDMAAPLPKGHIPRERRSTRPEKPRALDREEPVTDTVVIRSSARDSWGALDATESPAEQTAESANAAITQRIAAVTGDWQEDSSAAISLHSETLPIPAMDDLIKDAPAVHAGDDPVAPEALATARKVLDEERKSSPHAPALVAVESQRQAPIAEPAPELANADAATDLTEHRDEAASNAEVDADSSVNVPTPLEPTPTRAHLTDVSATSSFEDDGPRDLETQPTAPLMASPFAKRRGGWQERATMAAAVALVAGSVGAGGTYLVRAYRAQGVEIARMAQAPRSEAVAGPLGVTVEGLEGRGLGDDLEREVDDKPRDPNTAAHNDSALITASNLGHAADDGSAVLESITPMTRGGARDASQETEASLAGEGDDFDPDLYDGPTGRAASNALLAEAKAMGPDAARADYERLLSHAAQADRNSPHPVVALAEMHFALGEFEEAKALAEQAVRMRRKRSAYRVLLGDILIELEHDDEAQAQYRTAVQLDPNDREARQRVTN